MLTAKSILPVLLIGLTMTAAVDADDGSRPPGEAETINVPTKTLGGSQFWGDVRFFQGWRIQQNVFTEHFRLLDPADVRRGWGTRKACDSRLDGLIKSGKIKPMSGTAVILLHGAIRSSKSMNQMATMVQQEGFTAVPFDYPSTRVGIDRSAEFLQQVIERLDGIKTIHFVTHSMGGLVVRSWSGRYEDRRVGRLVMLGVPNRGAQMADRVKGNLLFRILYGPAGQQVGSDPDGFIAKLAIPKFEFAVIAGKAGKPGGYNPLVPGDDDGTVAITSTRLPGAIDFASIRGLHSFLMNQPQVIDWTRRFLKSGHLREGGKRQPIPHKDDEPDRSERSR